MHRGVESEYMWGSYGTSVSAFKTTTYQRRECQSHIVTRFGEILRLGNEVLFSVPTLSRHICLGIFLQVLHTPTIMPTKII